MTNTKDILCAVDFNHNSLAAEHAAYFFSKKLNTGLTLFHVDTSLLQFREMYAYGGVMMPPIIGEQVRERLTGERLKQLAQRVHSIGAASDKNVSADVAFGEPRYEILENLKTRKNATEMVVLSKRKRTFFGEFFLGSVAQHVANEAHCPVLIMPDAIDYFLKWEPKNLLVAVSLATDTHKELQYAHHLAQKLNARLTLVHVTPDPTTEHESLSTLLGAVDEGHKLSALFETQESAARTALQDAAKRAGMGEENIEICVRKGSAAEQIFSVADAANADLILMGANTKPQGHWHLGGVTSALARTARKPLLVIK